MLAEQRQDRGTLHWIRGELDQTLREARAALEDHVEGQADRLVTCVDLLHHVHGALEMVQVYGAAMLADEMEQLAKGLAGGGVKRADAAAEALMLGMVQLPAYLEKIEGGSADVPLALLPLMNDLRSARDAPLVSETSLFAPKLNAVIAAETVRPGSGSRELPRQIQLSRSHFHRAMLNWIRGADVEASLRQIRKVLAALSKAAGTARLKRLLDAAEALAASLMDDQEEPALAVKPLFGQVDRVLKKVIDRGEESAMLSFPTELLKNLLYYIARSTSRDPAVLAVKRAADLANTFTEEVADGAAVGSLGAPDRELFQAVGEALAQDLRDVKDRLDLYIRSDRGQLERLTGLVQPIQRIADTLGMVGRGELRTRLKHRCDELQAAEQTGEAPAEERLMTLAEDLLFVESSLVSMTSGGEPASANDQSIEGSLSQTLSEGELKQHMRAAIDEALVELARTKDSILEYLEKPDHPELLSEVPSRLHIVAGVLNMLELPEAAHLLRDLKPYVASLATGQSGVPDAQQRDALADVVISAELYMQSAIEPGSNRAKLLHYAEAALQRLGLREAPEGQEATPRAVEAAVDEEASAGPAVEQGWSTEPAASMEQVAEASVTPAPPEPSAGDLIDPEILAVFGEEAVEELEVIQGCYPQWRTNPDDRESLSTMRRSFHTLKGSGRIVGASNIGEFSWAVENLLNRVIDGTVLASPEVLNLLDEVVGVLPTLVEESRHPGAPGTDVSALAQRAFALASGEITASPTQIPPGPSVTVDEKAAPETDTAQEEATTAALSAEQQSLAATEAAEAQPAEQAVAAGPDTRQEAVDESILTATEVQDSEFTEFESASASAVDSSLNAVFINEAEGHLNVLGNFIAGCEDRAGACFFDEGVRRAMHTLRGSARTASVEPLARLAGVLESFANTMHAQQHALDDAMLELLDRAHRAMRDITARVEDHQSELPPWEALCDEIDTFAANLAQAETQPQAPLEAPTVHEGIDAELLEVFLDEAKELLEALETQMADWEDGSDEHRSVAQLQRTLHTMKGGARLAGVSAVGDLSHALESVFESVVEHRIDSSERLKTLVRRATDALAQDIDKLSRGDMPVVSAEMIEALEAAAHDRQWDEAVKQEAEIGPSQAQATVEETVAQGDTHPVSENVGVDEFAGDSELLADSQLMTDSELLSDSSFLLEALPDRSAQQGGADAGKASTVVQFPSGAELAEGDGYVARKPVPEEPPAPVGGGERVRVAAEALDQMVNNAGEVSIYRARIEQQVSSVEFNLGELEQTVDRLRGQLRSLELETEAQILSRHEREGDVGSDFDPLEMDRYSTIHQLSRALSETVEDLSNLGDTLTDLSRDTDTLLLQQARVTNDLQDSLLRTRMVKFSSRVPRLERVVRQTSHSVGKQAVLEVVGGEEDMDRAILERMMGPLEHLLRNAVSHGIEEPDTRLHAGKAPQGVIALQLAREGTDIVITLSDDGAGLDRERIRTKAIERGLLTADAVIEDDDLYQLTLQPGFSTAQALSQVAGRGVGMDVVLTEVKQLGGALEIESRPGEGARFTIRLPFTLAITDALLVTLGDEIFAVPHSSMDGVVRIQADELRAIYAGDQEDFQYGGRSYHVRYLGSMLGMQAPQWVEGTRWLPMLLVRSGEHRVAIHVDGLLGNRQIVVKSIGAQLSGVRWFTGGTILADGQIALILDINSLVRMDSTQQAATPFERAAPATKGVSVMVVDDSITVRKVTSRLLERHNMQVLTAKDGVDAVTVLQEHHPDVMLLDIEMPRMDGYELARHMRSTPELSDIPIIMITSRTGDKHRSRAIELGVKRYLGKPYQEAELLENIYTVLADKAL